MRCPSGQPDSASSKSHGAELCCLGSNLYRADCAAAAITLPLAALIPNQPGHDLPFQFPMHTTGRGLRVLLRSAATRKLHFMSFSSDPLADVRWTILELNTIRFAASEKPDNVSIHESEVF